MATTKTEEQQPSKKPDEAKVINEWRFENFRNELKKAGVKGVTGDDLEALVYSDVSPHDVKKLKRNGCPPNLILKILK